MLIHAIMELHEDIRHRKLGAHRRVEIGEREQLALTALPTSDQRGLLQ
jgi:NADH-quinone oxidoreductase subunit B